MKKISRDCEEWNEVIFSNLLLHEEIYKLDEGRREGKKRRRRKRERERENLSVQDNAIINLDEVDEY